MSDTKLKFSADLADALKDKAALLKKKSEDDLATAKTPFEKERALRLAGRAEGLIDAWNILQAILIKEVKNEEAMAYHPFGPSIVRESERASG